MLVAGYIVKGIINEYCATAMGWTQSFGTVI